MIEKIIEISDLESVGQLFGNLDENLKVIEKQLNVSIFFRESKLKIIGDQPQVDKAVRVINGMQQYLAKGESLNEQNILYIISLVTDNEDSKISKLTDNDYIYVTVTGKPIKPKTLGQKHYCDAIENNTIVLGIGPAGTGKTYLAVAQAVKAFKQKQVNRIILTRPAVEAGEKLGYLPGDLQQKVDPYLRPLYDALFEMFGAESFAKNVEKGHIEVAPLAYMRGRTLDDSFIILDEAQNTTKEQMKMFLTRLGFNSKMIVTGDITQVDLQSGQKSGLTDAMSVLKGIEDIQIIKLTEKDVVRHKLVQCIVKAYEKTDESRRRKKHGQNKSNY